MGDVKTCTKCGETKPLSEFHRDASTKDGLQYWCKACRREYYKTHREERAEYREAHCEEKAEYARKYYKAHKKEMAEYRREYHEANREKELEQQREYYRTHREKELERRREYYRTHREEELEKRREYREANPVKIAVQRAKRRALKHSVTTGDQNAIDAIYDLAKNGDNVRCYLCDELISKGDRHVDHIVPLSRGGEHTASNLAIACSACNLSKSDKLPQEIGLLL